MLLLGDCKDHLKDIKDNCIDCVVTSPPYWGLRDYKTEGQLGLEPTFQEYINKLVGIFDQVKRVLKKEGSCWVVIGDTYQSTAPNTKNTRPTNTGNKAAEDNFRFDSGLPGKSLLMIPQRFAIAMLDKGWILRNDIIWYKPNCMPSSATDRFTVDYEHIFFFTKSQNYYFETQYEPLQKSTIERDRYPRLSETSKYKDNHYYGLRDRNNGIINSNGENRIKRTVWKITTKPYPEAHFAVFPEELIKTPILAGCPEGGIVLDPFAGSGTTLKAAHQLNRKWIGIEINPDYVQLAKKRLTPYIQQQRLEQFLDS